VFTFGPVVTWSVTELPIAEAVFLDPWFGAVPRALEVKLSDHTAVITLVGDQSADQGYLLRKCSVPASSIVQSGRVETSHETASARSTNRALAVGVSEGDTTLDQFIDIGGVHVGISQSGNRVETLLISTYQRMFGRSESGIEMIVEK